MTVRFFDQQRFLSVWPYWTACVLLLCVGGVRAEQTPAGVLLDRVVAVVNDEVITAHELQLRLNVARAQLTKRNIALPSAQTLERQVLEQLILQRAQLQLARETGVRVDDVTVNGAIGRIAEQNDMTVSVLRDRLDKEGVSFARYREDIRNEIILARLREREVDNRIVVSAGEIDAFLAREVDAAATPELLVGHILLRVPEGADADVIQAVRERAQDLWTRLEQGGADFAQLAASYSAGPEALEGGQMGWRKPERLPALFYEAVKDLQPGGLAAVQRSPAGFHLLKLLDRRRAAADEAQAAADDAQAIQQTHARHILLRVSDAMPESEVIRRLSELRGRVITGQQDFAQLARLHSVDPSSTRGGDLGWLYPGDTVPEFERAMNGLKINEVSEPVQSPFGWHLIQVLERRSQVSDRERRRLKAQMAIREQKAEAQFQEWLRQLHDRTYVEYRLED